MKTATATILNTALLTIGLSLGTAAIASPIPSTVDLTFRNASGLFPEGNLIATINYNNGDTSKSSRVRAGMFGGTASNGVNFEPTTLFRSEDGVLAYCVDILNNLLRSANTYNVNSLASDEVDVRDGVRRDFGRTLDFLGAVNFVTEQNYRTTEDDPAFNWLTPSASWMSAAIQVGIWESLYEQEQSDLSITGDDDWFSASFEGSERDKQSAANFLEMAFSAMSTTEALDASRVKWLQIEGGQDLLVDPVDVPVPGTLLLTAAGLGLLRLRKKR